MRTHISLPEDLVKELDEVVGNRKRSGFIEEAVRRQLQLEKQHAAFRERHARPRLVRDPMDDISWEGVEDSAAWVRNQRAQGLALEIQRRVEREKRYLEVPAE